MPDTIESRDLSDYFTDSWSYFELPMGFVNHTISHLNLLGKSTLKSDSTGPYAKMMDVDVDRLIDRRAIVRARDSVEWRADFCYI